MSYSGFARELDAAVRLAHCKDPNEVASQAEFANKMADDYFAECKKIVEVMGELAKEFSTSSNRVRNQISMGRINGPA